MVYDVTNIVPYVMRYKKHPVTGQPLALRDLVRLTFHKNGGALRLPALHVSVGCCVLTSCPGCFLVLQGAVMYMNACMKPWQVDAPCCTVMMPPSHPPAP